MFHNCLAGSQARAAEKQLRDGWGGIKETHLIAVPTRSHTPEVLFLVLGIHTYNISDTPPSGEPSKTALTTLTS